MKSGIYQIRNQINGKHYVGSSVNLRKRRAVHLSALRHGRHENQHLQRAFDKDGEEAFEFSVLEHIEDALRLIPREQHFLDTLKPEYNISPNAGSSLGYRHTEEARRTMSELATGERNPFCGKCHSEKAKQKMRKAHIGKHLSEETRARISEAKRGDRSPNYGRHPSEETRAKMSRAQRGKRRSVETRAKMSLAQSGERHPFYGRHHSNEARRKMSIARKEWWRRSRIPKNRGETDS